MNWAAFWAFYMFSLMAAAALFSYVGELKYDKKEKSGYLLFFFFTSAISAFLFAAAAFK